MISILMGDITKESVDVIVNAANTKLAGGGGVDGAIHRAAGPAVMEECRQISVCPVGEAVLTGAGNLKVKKIIHTVGPVWHGGGQGEASLLQNAYENSFLLAKHLRFKSIAFPAISTGVYGYPKEPAAWIALGVGKAFVNDFKEIRYLCFSEEDFEVYQFVWTRMLAETSKKG